MAQKALKKQLIKNLWHMQTNHLICQEKKSTFLHNDSDIQTFLGVTLVFKSKFFVVVIKTGLFIQFLGSTDIHTDI